MSSGSSSDPAAGADPGTGAGAGAGAGVGPGVGPTVSSGSLERLRVGNAAALTTLLADHGPLSRSDLARRTGLARATVSSLVAELIARGRVVEAAQRGRPHRDAGGRPPVLLRLSVPAGSVAGVDLGHRHVRVVVADRAGEVHHEQRVVLDVDADAGRALDRAADLVRESLAAADLPAGSLRGVGMCLPGPLDARSSRLGVTVMPGWRDLSPASALAERLGVDVHVENDANLGALAERAHGSARGLDDVVYVKVANGLGAGLVLGGRLHRGATGRAGELGHLLVDPDGDRCRCGRRGCLETVVSTGPLLRALRPVHGEHLVGEDLARLEEQGHADVRALLAAAGEALGRPLADLATHLDLQAVVVGGALARSSALADGLRAGLEAWAQPETLASLTVLPGALGARAEVLGAVSLALSRVGT